MDRKMDRQDNKDGEKHQAPEETSPASETRLLRCWPAVLITITMWIVMLVPEWFIPLTKLYFVLMHLGPLIGVIGLSLWWIATRVLPLKKHLLGVALMGVLLAVAMAFMHPSMTIIMLFRGAPIAMSVMVAGWVLSRSLRMPRQGWIGVAGFVVVMFGALLVRSENMDADFAFDMVPRWKPTAEDHLLASLDDHSPLEKRTDIVLPQEVSLTDWAEFRGPRRDGILTAMTFATNWETSPPPEIWRRPVGPGWSSFCVVGPLFFTQEQRGEMELVSAYTVADASPVWVQETKSRFEASMGGLGPRATPTYRDRHLYVTGGSGLIQCLDAATGVSIWQFDLIEALEVRMPDWGFSSSPLVLDDIVVVFAGGGDQHAMVALDRKEGTLVWSIGNGSHGYSSPQLATLQGVTQILITSNRGVQSVIPETGELLWRHEWDMDVAARVTQPTVVGNTVYLGTGYGGGTMRIDIHRQGDQWTTEEGWIAPMKPYFNDCVYQEGYLYGFDGPIFMCLDAESGKKAWKRGRYGHGQVLLIQDIKTLLITTEKKGDLILVEANPEKLVEVARIKSVEGITWNHPVIAQGKLFVRNGQEMVCYDLASGE